MAIWPSLVYVASIALLRDAAWRDGSELNMTYLMPIVWIALWGRKRELAFVSAGVAAALIAPEIFVGPPRYPASGWREAALILCISVIIGAAIRRLLSQLRRSAEALDAREQERSLLVQQLQTLAHTDTLTGLANRRLWTHRLESTLAQTEERVGLCLAFLDVDGFKGVNDRDGHAAGDRLLIECAQKWRAHLRATDLLARLGGDEFAVFLPACPLEDAQAILERVRLATPPGVTVSVGLVARVADETADALLTRADDMLYRPKREGRNQVRVAEHCLPARSGT
jgi:diguanylate cyclase (GGDEF)-like protein